MNAPSWYVFCCDGYRVPGAPESPKPAAPVIVSACAKARKTRSRIQRGDIESLAIAVLVLVASVWYRLHLSVPHR